MHMEANGARHTLVALLLCYHTFSIIVGFTQHLPRCRNRVLDVPGMEIVAPDISFSRFITSAQSSDGLRQEERGDRGEHSRVERASVCGGEGAVSSGG